MKHLNRVHRKLLSDLLKAHGKLDSFTLFKRSKVSFSEFASATRFLFDAQLTEEDEDNVILSKKGKEYITSIEITQEGQYKWREIPNTLKINSIDIDEPYIPNIELLDKRTFNIKLANVD